MAYTTIDDPSAHFHVRLYTGTGSSNSVTNNANAGDFKPDWIWIKNRTDDAGHPVFDSSRGVNKNLTVNVTDAEATVTTQVTAFGSNGFTVGSNNGANGSSDNLVAWQWKANGGTTSSDSNGDITSTVQANTTAGFSIVTWTGNGTDGNSVGTGLSGIWDLVIFKNRSAGDYWTVDYDPTSGDNKILLLHDQVGQAGHGTAHVRGPSSGLMSLHSNGDLTMVNGSSENYVAYVFKQVQGFSKFGTYTGTANADGPFIYTGFKPAWVMIKEQDYGNNNQWNIYDNKRSPVNPMDEILEADTADAESTGRADIDFLSNGFKNRSTHAECNRNNVTFRYMAFAEHPYVSSKGVPTTAR